MKASEAASIRAQIEALQAQLAEAETKERAEALAQMKEFQRTYHFNARELGLTFRAKKRG
jgi:nitrate/nitrite-specific signal transduction histidine kinase